VCCCYFAVLGLLKLLCGLEQFGLALALLKTLITPYEFINDHVAIFVIEDVGIITERIVLNITIMEI